MDLIRLLPFPLPPAAEQLLVEYLPAEYLPRLPTLTDTLTVVFERVPLFENQLMFYLLLGILIYVVVSMVLSTMRWMLNLFTFAIKAAVVVAIGLYLYQASQGGEGQQHAQLSGLLSLKGTATAGGALPTGTAT
ncbi:hypothetical protein THASP1DRAFT_27660 [Thamnocephalis sphaerospora]|uniref:Nuclear pore assembly and biogenesis-domain-containing protein n=1 Tax=Thamnocephalis sphaerospora TaxID=78915 RepID=A0A4P9XW69_9FUNG|nr:hypothetical protein THASP1DRAFT_27660 [Thamnocephalis sphaerospora]|eukprot:RKP10563.1 hypothetical protein THASP1DRAFT_27660 [Thamnocephalis sphaerospora]